MRKKKNWKQRERKGIKMVNENVKRTLKYEVILTAETPENFYGDTLALINRKTEFDPWVIAEGYKEDSEWGKHWGQGHYFENFKDAVGVFAEMIGFKSTFQYKTERNLKLLGGSVDRLIEIASRALDKIEEDNTPSNWNTTVDEDEKEGRDELRRWAKEESDLSMTDEELEFFGKEEIELEDEEEEDE